jgi:hypothetical protein
MILQVQIQNYLSVSLPVARVLDNQGKLLLLNEDFNSARLLVPGQTCKLMSANGKGLKLVRNSCIRTVEEEPEGVIVNIK